MTDSDPPMVSEIIKQQLDNKVCIVEKDHANIIFIATVDFRLPSLFIVMMLAACT